jgi:ribonuclease BN (tRNA processing enzyme)
VDTISVTFLGSGDAFGSGGRDQTCIYVDAGTVHFLIDCGASSLSAMKRWGVDPASIDVILITHLHGDHFGGLPFVLLEAQLVSKRTRPLLVAGPPGFEARVRAAMEVFFPGSTRLPLWFAVVFRELAAAVPTNLGSLTVTPQEVIHASGAPAYAVRVECAEKTIAYSGDTEWTDALRTIAQGADLFICEAYFFDKPVRYHLDYQTLARHRAELDCRRLVVTHMSDDMLARVQSLDTEYAEDGKQIAI